MFLNSNTEAVLALKALQFRMKTFLTKLLHSNSQNTFCAWQMISLLLLGLAQQYKHSNKLVDPNSTRHLAVA